MFATLILFFVAGIWRVTLVAGLVLCFAALAEAMCLNGKFGAFYMLKAPALYISVIFICTASIGGAPALVLAMSFTFLVLWYAAKAFVGGGGNGIHLVK